MPAAEYQATETEAQLLAKVRELAGLRGFLTYHTHDSRRSEAGFPDLVMVRGHRIIFAELKTQKGRVSEQQVEWLEALREVSRVRLAWPDESPVEVYLWRPADFDEIVRVLR